MNKEIIRPGEAVENLVRRGIVPEWIWRDCEPHGMYEAEYLLCEYDWEWGWDLGDGYTPEQLKVLRQVRERVAKGIANYRADKDLVARDKEEAEKRRRRYEKRQEYLKKYAGSYVDRDDIDWVIEFEEKYGKLPYVHFICFRTLLPTRTDIQKAQLLSIGVTADDPMQSEEVHMAFPELPVKKLKDLPYKTWALYQGYKDIVGKVLTELPEELPEVNDGFWRELISSQRLGVFGLTPIRLYRLLLFFRLNELSLSKRKSLSKGVY